MSHPSVWALTARSCCDKPNVCLRAASDRPTQFNIRDGVWSNLNGRLYPITAIFSCQLSDNGYTSPRLHSPEGRFQWWHSSAHLRTRPFNHHHILTKVSSRASTALSIAPAGPFSPANFLALVRRVLKALPSCRADQIVSGDRTLSRSYLFVALAILLTGCSKLPLEVEAPTFGDIPICFTIRNIGSEPITIEGVKMNDKHSLTKVVYHFPPLQTVVGLELGEGDSVSVDNNHLSESLNSIEVFTNRGNRKFRF